MIFLIFNDAGDQQNRMHEQEIPLGTPVPRAGELVYLADDPEPWLVEDVRSHWAGEDTFWAVNLRK